MPDHVPRNAPNEIDYGRTNAETNSRTPVSSITTQILNLCLEWKFKKNEWIGFTFFFSIKMFFYLNQTS